jgi:AGCS family alanine or glycine:cation symporter
MMKRIESLLIAVNELIWGPPLIAALLIISMWFSFKLGFLQISKLKFALKCLLEKDSKFDEFTGNISNFASLCTAMSATLGTGNIVGVALAISTGGPGAMFWMLLSAFFGMATKYAEGFLAVKYRKKEANGATIGGPMYYIEIGLGNKILAKLFAGGGILVALFGIGTLAQTNSIVSAANSFGIPTIPTICILGITVAIIVMGGVHRIASVSEKIVPLMSVFYIGAAIFVIIMKISLLPHAIHMIFVGAFSPEAILGGGVGISIMTAARLGISRGIFSHESGLGSAAIAAAEAKTDSPVKQGLVSMIGALFSTIVCTMTGLVLILTSEETAIFSSKCILDGTLLTSYAFGHGLGIFSLGQYIVNIGIVFFAFTTSIGWNYYGEKCIQYLWGKKVIFPYQLFFLFLVVVGPFFKINAIFILADVVIGLMAIPNLIGLFGLRKVIIAETIAFFRNENVKN